MTLEGAADAVRSYLDVVDVDHPFVAGSRDTNESVTADCDCRVAVGSDVLEITADSCDGALATAPLCRRAAIDALVDDDVDRIVVRDDGLEYRYRGRGVELLAAAGRFVDRLGSRDDRWRRAAYDDPLAASAELDARSDSIAAIGAESGLVEVGRSIDGYEAAFEPTVGLTIGHYRIDRTVGSDARLRDVRTLETGSEARIYTRPAGVERYVLDVVDLSLSASDRRRLLEGYEAIADGKIDGDRAASRALERADEPVDPEVTTVLEKHTRGYGVLEDLFADPEVTDVYVTSPVDRNPVRVVVDGEAMATNVSLTADGARALASRVRRTSGRAFSRASPTVDATATLANGTGVRVAGVTDPVADGDAFAFRERPNDRFTLPGLVANGTMSADAAAVLSVAVERNAATLIAGTRGSGKTTLLGTLLYELPTATRTVLIEDTPELPVEALQTVGRDVQALRTGTGDGPEIAPAEALRTALRLGDGALVVGEIRGEEAAVLYEAMRVGANANAVMGTIHGDGAGAVYERVVSDLGVPPASFGATDLVVTVQSYRTQTGRTRRLSRIEEVISDGDEHWFEPLYALDGPTAEPTGRIDRGESRVVDQLTRPTESYADVRRVIERRADHIGGLARDGRTSPREVTSAYARRERSAE